MKWSSAVGAPPNILKEPRHCCGNFWRREISEDWAVKTASWRNLGPQLDLKDGLVNRGYESQIPRAVSQPSDLYGKNKLKSDEVWWLGISLAAVLEAQAGVKISGASVRAGSSGQH